MMYGCRRPPPDVVSNTGACRDGQPELDPVSTFRRPPGDTQGITNGVTSSLTSSLTSSTPDLSVSARKPPARTASRHVVFRLDESTTSVSPPDLTNGASFTSRPTADFDVEQSPTDWIRLQRQQTQSMIMIGEDDVDQLFQPVSINGDSFALLQTPIRSRQLS